MVFRKTLTLSFGLVLQVGLTLCLEAPSGKAADFHEHYHPPPTDFCKYYKGEYIRDDHFGVVCCQNATLQMPKELTHMEDGLETFINCSKNWKTDADADFPTGMWNTMLCEMKKYSVIKPNSGLKLESILNFFTKSYPLAFQTEIKKEATTKCSYLDAQRMADDAKLEKYMSCFQNAENTVCHKPYGSKEDHAFSVEDAKFTKELGCPVIPGMLYVSSAEHCCKKRSTPYSISFFPPLEFSHSEENFRKYEACLDSFDQREFELKVPEKKKGSGGKAGNQELNASPDYQLPWSFLCHSVCYMEHKNYTKSMLIMDFDKVANFFTEQFSKTMKLDIRQILSRRKEENIFLNMEDDKGTSKPMNLKELSAKFSKAAERQQIQYYCKFVETIVYEERRALHEYCFDQKVAEKWATFHQPMYIPHPETDDFKDYH